MSDREGSPEFPVGVVLGSEDAGPLEFWSGSVRAASCSSTTS